MKAHSKSINKQTTILCFFNIFLILQKRNHMKYLQSLYKLAMILLFLLLFCPFISQAQTNYHPPFTDQECATQLMKDYMGEMPQLAELNCALEVLNQMDRAQNLFSWTSLNDPANAISSTVLACGGSALPAGSLNRVVGFLGEASNRNSTTFADHPCFEQMWNAIDAALASAPHSGNSGMHGEPRILTLDKLHYSFHAEGSFLGCLSQNNQLEIQTLFKGYKQVGSLVSAVAFRLQTDVITFSVSSPNVFVNGAPYLGPFPIPLKSGGKVLEVKNTPNKKQYMVVSKEGDYFPVKITKLLIDFRTILTDQYKGKMKNGLLGNFDGDRNNDLTTSNGEIIKPFNLNKEEKCVALYKKFGNSWRVDINNSIFPDKIKQENQSINLNFPTSCYPSELFTPAKINEAKNKSLAAGIKDPFTLQNSIFDYVITENDDVIEANLEHYYISTNQLVGEYEVYFSYKNNKNERIENTLHVALGAYKSSIDGGNEIVRQRIITDYANKTIRRYSFQKGKSISDLKYDIEMKSNGFITYKSIKTNEKKLIDGIECTKYNYSDNKKRTGEMWVAESLRTDYILPFNNVVATLKGIALMKFPRFASINKDGLVLQATIHETEGDIEYKINKLNLGLPNQENLQDPNK